MYVPGGHHASVRGFGRVGGGALGAPLRTTRRLTSPHRIATEQVLLDRSGTAKVADVGIAIHLHGLTTTGASTTGTPLYMSPEQWRGEQLTAKSDVYAYGLLLNELLTKQKPWRTARAHSDVRYRVITGAQPDPVAGMIRSRLPLLWSMEPGDRPTMQQVLAQLNAE